MHWRVCKQLTSADLGFGLRKAIIGIMPFEVDYRQNISDGPFSLSMEGAPLSIMIRESTCKTSQQNNDQWHCEMYIVFHNFVFVPISCGAIVAHVMYPSEPRPLPPSSDQRAPYFSFLRMILNGIHIQRSNFDGAIEPLQQDANLGSDGAPVVWILGVICIDTFAYQVVPQPGRGGRHKLEGSKFSSHRAAGNNSGSRHHYSVEQVKSNFSMRGQVVDGGNCLAIIVTQIFNKNINA
jgi:hypothetical protein